MINSTRTHSRTRGFTLIELLVVLLVIALISSITVLSMGDSTLRTINQDAQRFQ
ncbi:prepilin-type N-terminal cleavage/methylation domain-containing protein, partial [bacterium]|nr:prepilin-type N-terminal cleavage/methylation domain-containing protein [bacterium]